MLRANLSFDLISILALRVIQSHSLKVRVLGGGGGGAYRLREGCVKVARYSFSGSIPLKFDHKPRRQKQSFGKIATTVVLEKDENLL